ncbi:bifunctional deaminase-reductase domain protein [Kribbella flavida DSM 17836]|uniref:Bifunctional deaminase-reductase domain protein n=1 Tax=Kribbella flavida (strain DSM 17836 / JCM 10339 / NBRC 14399) TaxID=479435 RepID=D2PX41_KRIFD|nr:dihydrofolate reductase family protein [Kribbella flavida]ADB35421.1 bifunctional deaminase-reductase domain protein [Kribbella flavida DSM 17836]
MAKILHYVHSSLDGFIEGPHGEFDWPQMGPDLSAHGIGLNEQVGTFLYGRVVWEMMSGFWPQAESISDHPHDLEFAPIWRRMPKVVVSSTLRDADWNTTVVGSVAEVAKLKQQAGGDILLSGGSTLAAALTAEGLIDEYHVVVHPVLLGGGKRLFPEGQSRRPLRLVESRLLDERAVLTVHAPAES